MSNIWACACFPYRLLPISGQLIRHEGLTSLQMAYQWEFKGFFLLGWWQWWLSLLRTGLRSSRFLVQDTAQTRHGRCSGSKGGTTPEQGQGTKPTGPPWWAAPPHPHKAQSGQAKHFQSYLNSQDHHHHREGSHILPCSWLSCWLTSRHHMELRYSVKLK